MYASQDAPEDAQNDHSRKISKMVNYASWRHIKHDQSALSK